jgi:hypothetical protein
MREGSDILGIVHVVATKGYLKDRIDNNGSGQKILPLELTGGR